MKTVKIFGKTIPLFAVIAIAVVASVIAAGTLWATIQFGPTTVTEEPLPEPTPFNPILTSTYDEVIGSAATLGTTYTFATTLTNTGDLGSVGHLNYYFTITDASDDEIILGDILVAYNIDDTTWHPLILVQETDGTLTGIFGPPDGLGFPVEADYDHTTAMTVTFNELGEYTAILTLEDVRPLE
jgi:hypothetical protein